MAEPKKHIYKEKATEDRKLRLNAELRAKAAEIAQRSDEKRHLAEMAIYELRHKAF